MNKISMKIFTVWAVAVVWLATSCTSYKTVPYMINSAEADLDSSAVLYERRVMPKDRTDYHGELSGRR